MSPCVFFAFFSGKNNFSVGSIYAEMFQNITLNFDAKSPPRLFLPGTWTDGMNSRCVVAAILNIVWRPFSRGFHVSFRVCFRGFVENQIFEIHGVCADGRGCSNLSMSPKVSSRSLKMHLNSHKNPFLGEVVFKCFKMQNAHVDFCQMGRISPPHLVLSL